MNNQSFLKVLVISIFVIIFISGGILLWQYLGSKTEVKEEVKKETENQTETQTKPTFNTTSKKLAVIREGYDNIVAIDFSPDGQNVAYVVGKEGKQFVVLNGKEGKAYDEARYLTFSPDSKQLAYRAKEREKYFIVLNGKEGKAYDYIYTDIAGIYFLGPIVFSLDSKQLAYVAEEKGKQFIVLNGKEGKVYDKVWNPIFSPDSKYIGYNAQINNELWWIVEKVEDILNK
jgi:Tol biopolymer transport system component